MFGNRPRPTLAGAASTFTAAPADTADSETEEAEVEIAGAGTEEAAVEIKVQARKSTSSKLCFV